MIARTTTELYIHNREDIKVEKTVCMVIVSIGNHITIFHDPVSGSDWIAKSIVDQLTPTSEPVSLEVEEA